MDSSTDCSHLQYLPKPGSNFLQPLSTAAIAAEASALKAQINALPPSTPLSVLAPAVAWIETVEQMVETPGDPAIVVPNYLTLRLISPQADQMSKYLIKQMA